MISVASARQHLLIVDDERSQLQTLSDIFTDHGFAVCGCTSFDEALVRCQNQSFAVAILDLRLRGQDGIELLQRVRQAQPGIRTIIHTAYGSFDSAKDAVNLGAFAYVEKCGDPGELVSQVHRAVEDRLTEALSESQQRFRDLLDDVVAIVWECELPSWRFTFVSQHAESILGYPVAQWLEEPEFWVNHIHAEDRDQCIAICTECTQRGEDHEFDYRAIAADGRTVWLRDLVHVVKDADGTPVQLRGVMFDVTEARHTEQRLHELESQLAHVSRLSSMGEMVAGIAHEINQPLAAISNFASACSNTRASAGNDSESQIEKWLDQIGQEAMRCGEIIRRLRNFVNKGDREYECVDLKNAIQESVDLINSGMRDQSVPIVCCLPDHGPQVFGSKVQLQQVIVNLLRNACDATTETEDPQIRVHLETDQGNAHLTVEDNGPGIDMEQRGQLFDAFFTTKPDGMGIGLAISKSIVQAHQGNLRFDPGTKSGAKFHLDLPLQQTETKTDQ